jgi:hypothetical protein
MEIFVLKISDLETLLDLVESAATSGGIVMFRAGKTGTRHDPFTTR